jgi:hypothetical protein
MSQICPNQKTFWLGSLLVRTKNKGKKERKKERKKGEKKKKF